jgi:hypothetical protein
MYIEQSPDNLTPRWEVQKTIILNQKVRAGSNFYMAVSAGTTGTVRPDHEEGIGNDGFPGIRWQYLHSGFGAVKITGYVSPTQVTATVVKRLPDQVVTGSHSKTITSVLPGVPEVYDSEGTLVSTEQMAEITVPGHGYTNGMSIIISGVKGCTGVNGTWVITVKNTNVYKINNFDPRPYISGGVSTRSTTAMPSYKWALEAWGGDDKYPGATAYFNQRQFFGGSWGKPQTFWASQVSGFESFATNIPLLDDDALTYSLNSRRVNEIRHFVELGKLILLTSDGPFILDCGQDGVLLPGRLNTKRQGASGASHMTPLIVGQHALYVQEKGSQVRSLGYSFADDSFIGQDLTVMSSHLFYRYSIVDWAYQSVPFSTAWAVRNDGTLLALTYMPEQEVIGWSRHDTQGNFENITSITEGNEDAVYLVVKRQIDGVEKRYIERFATRYFSSLEDAFFVDSGLTYDGNVIDPLTEEAYGPVTTISGLDHLEGETVSILADGNVVAPQVVIGGTITLQNPSTKVHIGLSIQSDFETLDISVAGQSIREKTKIINHVSVIVEETSGIKVGPDADHLVEIKQRTDENYNESTRLLNGMADIRVQTTWNKSGNVFIRQDQPLPITILATIPEMNMGGS